MATDVRVSQVAVEVAIVHPNPQMRVSQVVIEVAVIPTPVTTMPLTLMTIG